MPVQRVRPQCSSNPLSDKTSIRNDTRTHVCYVKLLDVFYIDFNNYIFSYILPYLCYWVFLIECESIGIAYHVMQRLAINPALHVRFPSFNFSVELRVTLLSQED